MRARSILVVVAVGMLTLGCGADDSTGPPQPEPGELQVTVAGSSAVGGIYLTVTGPGITAPVASGDGLLYSDVSGTTLSATVVGASMSGTVLTFSVPDTRDVADYLVTIQQVAGTSNQLLSPGAFTVGVSVVP